MLLPWDYEIALCAWLAAAALALWYPNGVWLFAAASVNVLVQRFIEFNAGGEFVSRVHDAVGLEFHEQNRKLEQMSKDVADVKEAQIKIAGNFRGRSLP